MFAACCECEGQKPEPAKQEQTFEAAQKQLASSEVHPTGVNAVTASQTPQKQPEPAQKQQAASTEPQQQQAEAPLSQRSQLSAQSLSPEEKHQEKLRLQELVKSFARDSVRGVSCNVVLVTGARASVVLGQYSLDRSLSKIVFQTNDGRMGNGLSVGLANIHEIYRFEDLGADIGADLVSLKAKLKSDLGEKELRRILVLKSTEHADPVSFLEADDLAKERFVTCIKILRLYCQTNTPEGGA